VVEVQIKSSRKKVFLGIENKFVFLQAQFWVKTLILNKQQIKSQIIKSV